jgi:hypothetical protein
MQAAKQSTVDLSKKCEDAASEFYKAGMRYVTALDEWTLANATASKAKLSTAREQIQIMETFLHRLFPDEFADTSSAAE